MALFAVLAALVLFFHSPVKTVAANVCEFQSDLKQLSSAETNSSSDIQTELAIRRNLLNQIIDCAINDAAKLQSNIKSLSINIPEIKDIQNRLVSKFDEIINYYSYQKTLVNNLGVEGSKRFAINLKDWRASNYTPLAGLGANFEIFSKNQELVQTTENRLNQMEITVRALKLTDYETIRTSLKDAENNFRQAKEYNNQAENVFKRLGQPDYLPILMKSSLEYLKNVYQNFFDIQDETQKIISR